MEYLKATDIPFDPRMQISELVVEAYYDLIVNFKKDIPKITTVLAQSLLLEYFYVAVENGEVASIVACKENKPPPVKLDKRVMVKHLGLIMGSVAYTVLNGHMINHKYPFELSAQTGSIEIVATSPKYRGRGIAQGLMDHVMSGLAYEEYVIEVIDINKAAIRLYEKMGFSEFMRTPAPKRAGFNEFIYMRRQHV